MNLNKVITIISGTPKDNEFYYACFVAENLSQILPNFAFKKLIIDSSDWQKWVEKECEMHDWSHTKSPLIWREIGICGGKPIYIGGNFEFKKFINTYYGIDVVLSDNQQKSLKLDYSFAQDLKMKSILEEYKSNKLHITISGAGRSVCPDLVAQLASLKEISDNGITISLYDTPGHFFKIKDIVKDAMAIGGELCSIKILENLSEGLKCCNILIILDHIMREEQETTHDWLLNNYEATKNIAEQIHTLAPSDIKVIFCSMGPICFCANVLIKLAVNLNKNNVVAVSSHYGLEMLYTFIKSLDIDNKDIGCPPVWGFLGISQYVDVHHTIHKCSVYVPNKRALTSKNSTLPLGIKYSEFRWLDYLSLNKNLYEKLVARKALCLYQVGRHEDFQKCKAICDLLKFWYQKDDTEIENNIITLGVSSNGTFNIPKGIFFSQPVYLKILNNMRVWVPCSEFPVPNESYIILKNCVETAKLILENMNLL